ncbi:glycosyltransferase [Methylocystis heyeri]|uniref:Glycosyltransferase n=1 Tax=Methylocystis heyeri TaxID=391905 RepID=A0A6B8KMK6_9HYPH|nr:glycosyltransferase [Methylocystis heyeri]
MDVRNLNVVILVDHGYVSGGQSKVAIESALGLAAAGATPVFFCACGPVDERLSAAGIRTVCLGQRDILENPSRAAAAMQGIWNLEAAKALSGVLRGLPRENTIIHVHGWAKALSPSIGRAIAASGLPAVYTMHEYFLFCPNGGFYDYRSDRVCHREPMSAACWATNCDSRNYPFKLWRNARLTIAELSGFPSVFRDFILISPLQEKLLPSFLPKGAAVHRVCNPVEAEPLGPKPAPATGDFLFVGRLSAEKGAALFAQAAEAAGVAAVFIGDGPAAGELRAKYPRARLLGWRSPAKVREAMRAARALVFPSLWYEGLGLTALEAKAMGTPVIVSDICAARDEIADGSEGLWFASGDAASLSQALRRMADDAQVARLAQGAYESYWRNPPTLSRHVAETLVVYEAALARKVAITADSPG